MKLNKQDIVNLLNIIRTCNVGEIEAFTIIDGYARGCNSNSNFVILSNNNIPTLPQKMGLSNLTSLRNMLSLFPSDAIEINAKESEKGEISSLEISSNTSKSKIQFRCTATALIKSPKGLGDSPSVSLTITEEERKMITNGVKAINGEDVQLIIKSGAASVTTSESSNSFSIELTNPVTFLDDNQESRIFNYAANIFKSALAASSQSIFQVGSQGIIFLEVNNHSVAVLQKIEED